VSLCPWERDLNAISILEPISLPVVVA